MRFEIYPRLETMTDRSELFYFTLLQSSKCVLTMQKNAVPEGPRKVPEGFPEADLEAFGGFCSPSKNTAPFQGG